METTVCVKTLARREVPEDKKVAFQTDQVGRTIIVLIQIRNEVAVATTLSTNHYSIMSSHLLDASSSGWTNFRGFL